MNRVLIANRGEIAVRVMRACRARGIETVAVYSEADAGSLHVREADRAVCIGPAAARESYLNIEALIAAGRQSGADAVHPGYGFLSEHAGFARAVLAEGWCWIGAPPEAIDAMGTKVGARQIMEAAGVPVVPGAHAEDATDLAEAAAKIGFPVLVKASSGGGGKGMRAVYEPEALEDALASAAREAGAAFGDATVYLERLLVRPRHVEIQIFADTQGRVVSLGERECSVQRRHQKVLEEAPSPVVSAELRARMGEAAIAAAQAVGYVGAGTVEFMLVDDGDFYFLEMNTRLQVEHPVTEMVFGVDLVDAQLRVAAGEPIPWKHLEPRGHAVEVRLYAEDPARDFLPASGTLHAYRPPEGPGIRHDGGLVEGDVVGTWYDPMMAKLIAYGPTRESALQRLGVALDAFVVHGVVTNLSFLRRLVRHPALVAGETHTGFIEDHFDEASLSAEPASEEALIAVALAQALGGESGSVLTSGARRGDWVSPWLSLGPWRGTA